MNHNRFLVVKPHKPYGLSTVQVAIVSEWVFSNEITFDPDHLPFLDNTVDLHIKPFVKIIPSHLR